MKNPNYPIFHPHFFDRENSPTFKQLAIVWGCGITMFIGVCWIIGTLFSAITGTIDNIINTRVGRMESRIEFNARDYMERRARLMLHEHEHNKHCKPQQPENLYKPQSHSSNIGETSMWYTLQNAR